MKEKQTGYILVGVLKVVAVAAVLLMVGIPIALKVMSDSSAKAYEKQIEVIKKAAQMYVTKNETQLVWKNDGTTVITLKQLQDQGYLDHNLIDARDKKSMKCAEIHVAKEGDEQLSYTVDTETCLQTVKSAS